MFRIFAPLLVVSFLAAAPSSAHPQKQVEMFCHRTANQDLPENTLESIALAARMGCNLVEVDVRETLDGQLVLNHDGFLDRLTDSTGVVEQTSFDELRLLDAGSWMGQRFTGLRIASFDDVLDLAHKQGIKLYLDMKTRGEGPLILDALRRHDMLDRVIFGGEWDDLRRLYPAANPTSYKYLPPNATARQIADLQHAGSFVVVNFSANPYEMDLAAMRAAVAAGADAINVDYPRLGADAIGRPVEATLAALIHTASTGSIVTRTAAIRELSRYTGFPTQQFFLRWLRDPDDQVSRAAAVALVLARPRTPASALLMALADPHTTARKNAAWALGMFGDSDITPLLPLLGEKDPQLLTEVLFALSRCPGEVPAGQLTPFLASDISSVRAAAALALARHHPQTAASAVLAAFAHARAESLRVHAGHTPTDPLAAYTQPEIDSINDNYREQMKLLQTIERLAPEDALRQLAAIAFQPVGPASAMVPLVAGFQLWDRIAANPGLAINALASTDIAVANRAEAVLTQAPASVLPALRLALATASAPAQDRLIRILAWQADGSALPLLHQLRQSSPPNAPLIDWAVRKIETLAAQR